MSSSNLRPKWFDDNLPKGWRIVSTRAAFSEKTDRSGKPSDNYLSLTANAGVIPYGEKGDVGNKAPEDMSKCKKVEPGDFVLNSMNFGIGSFGVSDHSGVCSSVYLVLKPNPMLFNPNYLKRVFEYSGFQKHAQSLGNGILAHRAAFGWDKLRSILIPLPPLAEQDVIVDFLDRELSQIDQLIRHQQQLTALLQTRKFSLVSSKPYGFSTTATIDESPNLPPGWVMRKLKSLVKIQASNVDKKNYEDGHSVRLCNYVDVYYNPEITDNLDFMEATASTKEIATFTLREGDVIITKDSESELDIGIPAFVPADLPGVVCGYHLSILRTKGLLDGRFLKVILDSAQAKSHFAQRANGLTRMALGQAAIGNLPVPLPPMDLQLKIASLLWSQLGKIDEAFTRSNALVKSLKERRSALVYAAVTGKLDLKEWQNG